jgi:hypothetical protein
MIIEISEMQSFPENSNPYHHDSFHMGTPIGKDLLMMHANHPSEEMNYFILVDTKTGERFKFTIERNVK